MSEYPAQSYEDPVTTTAAATGRDGRFDVRDHLSPRRLTMAMWDQAFLLRHHVGGGFEDYARVCRETAERGYNTVRLDPMPHILDLDDPDKPLRFGRPAGDFMPWANDRDVEGPVGRWLIDFVETLSAQPGLHYTLSPWYFEPSKPKWAGYPPPHRLPRDLRESADLTAAFLETWRRRFGFDRLVYVDLCNEFPFFMPGYQAAFAERHGRGWSGGPRFAPEVAAELSAEFADALRTVQRAFPELRFTVSMHADLRWLDLDLPLDCLDVHFYAQNDARWSNRTRFGDHMPRLFDGDDWHGDFSDRCARTLRSVGPMLRQKQRKRLMAFAGWARDNGTPLTTSESWSTWYYIDAPRLDWGWLLEWAEWSVEDAIDAGMWGWTPHNYLQPQFANWDDACWHQRLTSKFLAS